MIQRCAPCETCSTLRWSAWGWLLFIVLGSTTGECQGPQPPNTAFDLPSLADGLMDQAALPGDRRATWGLALDDAPLPRREPGEWYRRRSAQEKFRLRGRIDTDFLWADQNTANQQTYGDLPDQVGLRRARIGAEGNPTDDSRYVAEIDMAAGDVVIRDLYFALGKLEDTGEFKFGHMREPFSLEGGTSANSFAFMERSAINVLDPARNWGLGFSSVGREENWTFSGGLFQAGTDTSDLQFATGSTTALTAKVTGLAWYDNHGKNLMHFGVAISERIPDQGQISINQRPQSPLLNFGDSSDSPFVPKLTVSARFQQLLNLQWAYANESFWSQAEWYGSVIDQTNGGPVFYHGSYLDVGYFLTGEHRNYLTKTGLFGPVSVQRPLLRYFSSKPQPEQQLGYGAWETTGRISYLDFVDSNAPLGPLGQSTGVFLPEATIGVNWYLADRLRLMFNYSYALPKETNTGTSAASVLGMRLGVFW